MWNSSLSTHWRTVPKSSSDAGLLPQCTLQLLLPLLLVFCCNSRSMTPITRQAAVDDEEQRPLVQDILEAAVDGHHV